jgi:hypothetical protein
MRTGLACACLFRRGGLDARARAPLDQLGSDRIATLGGGDSSRLESCRLTRSRSFVWRDSPSEMTLHRATSTRMYLPGLDWCWGGVRGLTRLCSEWVHDKFEDYGTFGTYCLGIGRKLLTLKPGNRRSGPRRRQSPDPSRYDNLPQYHTLRGLILTPAATPGAASSG